MVLDHNDQIIFIHIPKTGGTSVESYFRNQRAQIHPQHAHPAWFKGNRPRMWQEYRTVTHVRNPWARYASAFNHTHPQLMAKPTAMEDFSLWIRSGIKFGKLFTTQLGFLRQNWKGSTLPEDEIQFIFKLEEANEKWWEYFEIKLPHINSGGEYPHYSQFYDDKLRDLVAEYCAEEIERWEFGFES